MTSYRFVLNGLHCANCAGKIEKRIARDSTTANTVLNFANKTITFDSNNSDAKSVLKWTQDLVDSIEDGVTVEAEIQNKKTDCKENDNEKNEIIRILISLGLFAVALLCEHIFKLPVWCCAVAFGVSVLVCGYKVIISGIKSLFKLKPDENALMAIAVIAAFCIGEFMEASLVTLLFSIGELLEDRAVEKSRRGIEKLAEIRPDKAQLLQNGEVTEVPAEAVRVDDVIVVKPHERIPLDGVIIKGNSLIDTSALTGESMPIDGGVGTELMSGMMNGEGMLTVKVKNVYEDSAASRILKMVEDSAASKGKSEKFITRFAEVYTPVIMLLAALLIIIPTIFTGEFVIWLSRALVFLVAACPCAIVISVPLGFYSGIGGISKTGMLIKGGKYIEALAKADTFVFDKTGTLTTGKLYVSSVKSRGKLSEEGIAVLAAAVEQQSNHPVAEAIKKYAENLDLPRFTDYREIAGIGVTAKYGDNEIACGNYRILKDKNGEAGIVYITVNNELQGEITVADKVREESRAVISKLKNLGAGTVAMLTGDSKTTAEKIAGECGLNYCQSGLLPEDKVRLMGELKEKSTSAVYVGDGINDAPVIANSDCGIAMGLGSQAAIEAADAVLTSGNLRQLPRAVKLSRKVMKTVKANIVFALGIKLVILVLAALGFAPMWLAVFADTGVCLLCVLNSSRLLYSAGKK